LSKKKRLRKGSWVQKREQGFRGRVCTDGKTGGTKKKREKGKEVDKQWTTANEFIGGEKKSPKKKREQTPCSGVKKS